MERAVARIPGEHGHGTTGLAKFWAAQLGAWLPTVPRRL
jgi:hypothetical protein